jgi:hypothetical protein
VLSPVFRYLFPIHDTRHWESGTRHTYRFAFPDAPYAFISPAYTMIYEAFIVLLLAVQFRTVSSVPMEIHYIGNVKSEGVLDSVSAAIAMITAIKGNG